MSFRGAGGMGPGEGSIRSILTFPERSLLSAPLPDALDTAGLTCLAETPRTREVGQPIEMANPDQLTLAGV